MSRIRITSACIGGSIAIAPPTMCIVSVASARSSGIPRQSNGSVDQCPSDSPDDWNAPGSNVGASRSSPASDANGTLRLSRWPRVFAVLTRIRKIHVRSDERPSNPFKPRSTPSQASCTTSSATASVDTYIRATRRIDAPSSPTSIMKAVSSPARSSSTSARSSVVVRIVATDREA